MQIKEEKGTVKDGFIKVAAATPDVQCGRLRISMQQKSSSMVHEMEEQGAKVMVFPELCITAYTCGDLFWQENLLEEAKQQLVPYCRRDKRGGRTDFCRTSAGIQGQAL